MEQTWGRYKVGKLLGKGVYGEVRLGHLEGESTVFAIKRFFSKGEGLDAPDEIAIALQASHPHIIQAKEYFHQGNQDYLVMELADTNLEDYFYSTLPENKEKIDLFYQLVSAVSYLQENGFNHCDIKPLNVLIKNGQVKLGDLGLSKYRNVRNNSCQSFASPQSVLLNYGAGGISIKLDQDLEVIFTERRDNFSNDVWALGVTFVFLLTGRLLFYDVDSAQEVVNNIQTYIRNPKEYLLDNSVPEKWLPLVLQMLEPRVSLRLPLARDILLQPEFVKRGFYQPISGYGPVFYDLPSLPSANSKLLLGAEWIKETVEEEGQNSFVLHAAITCFYYMAQYPIPRFDLLVGACLSLMSSVYSAYPIDIDNLIVTGGRRYTQEQLFSEERRIMDQLQGRLYFTTLAKLAFSDGALEKSTSLLLDPPAYLSTNLEQYMESLLGEETIEERNHRGEVY